MAEELWASVPEAAALLDSPALLEAMLQEVQHPVESVQRAAAAALAGLVQRGGGGAAEAVLQHLQDEYEDKLPVRADRRGDVPSGHAGTLWFKLTKRARVACAQLIPARVDSFGHVISAEVDEWGSRRGAALAVRALAPLLPPHAVPAAVRFFVRRGLADRAEPVRAEMLNAAMAVVDIHGRETLGTQLPVFEEFLDSAPKSGSFDAVRQSVVLLVGSLARHLEPSDARIKPITLRLVAALSTPSQQVRTRTASRNSFKTY